MNRPPPIPTPLNELPTDPTERHERLVEIFGSYFTWALGQAMAQSKAWVESAEARRPLGRLSAVLYAQIADSFPEEQRKVIYAFSRQTLVAFARHLLAILSAQGISHPLGTTHAIQFRLIMDICEKRDMEVVSEEVLNRGGERVFSDYLNHWLQQHPQ